MSAGAEVPDIRRELVQAAGWEHGALAAGGAEADDTLSGRALNGSLRRRIETLNCGHAAFPIILGVNAPQYTPAQLEKFRADNEKGVTVDGVHYTGYQATQMQRSVEIQQKKVRYHPRQIAKEHLT